MANKQISELTAASTIGDVDLMAVEQNGFAKKLKGESLKNWLTETATEIIEPTITSATEAAQSANTAAAAANASKEACDDAVEALPTTIQDMFAALGLALIDGKLCTQVVRD